MERHPGIFVGLAVGLGCSLLQPYPGGGDPADAVAASDDDGPSPFNTGDPQDPLDDPATDSTITVVSNLDRAVSVPGTAFTIDLGFVAKNANVVGGGIRFPGSEEVQWTFIDGLRGEKSGTLQFGYVVDMDVCEDIPNLCHEIMTTQFAVAENTGRADVDKDGTPDGQYVVSEGVEVPIVLQCATCDSTSCQDLLPIGECYYCGQPQICKDYFDRCLAEGRPNAGTDEAQLFDRLFGPEGVLWNNESGCALGENACDNAQQNASALPDECGL